MKKKRNRTNKLCIILRYQIAEILRCNEKMKKKEQPDLMTCEYNCMFCYNSH